MPHFGSVCQGVPVRTGYVGGDVFVQDFQKSLRRHGSVGGRADERAVISRYSNHAANERTYLAWMRTAIAVMAFGFLVEKLDFFLEVAARSLGGQPPTVLNQAVGAGAGLLLILLGGSIMVVATVRFRQTGRDVDASETYPAQGARLDMTLVGLLLALGGTLLPTWSKRWPDVTSDPR